MQLHPFILLALATVPFLFNTGLQVSGYSNFTVTVICWSLAGVILLLAGVEWARKWHRARWEKGLALLDSWYFIAPCIALAILFLAGAAFGLGLRANTVTAPVKALQDRPSVDAAVLPQPLPGSVLLTSRYYSAKNKEEVADFLDKISGTINKTGDEMLLLTEKAINQSPWDRPGENIEPFIQQMDAIITKAAQMHAIFYDEMLANEREYRVEMNAILFPQEPFIDFQSTAKAFRNGLSVWNQMRKKSDGAERQELLNLVMSSRMSFGHARDVFVKWLSRRQEIIDQTRMALRS